MIQEVTFDEAINRTAKVTRDLLLGNGFSIAAHDEFRYDRLLDRASIPDDVRAIFTMAQTTNFEAVMRILLAEATGLDRRRADDAKRKIELLKHALIQAIHEVHPLRRTSIGPTQWASCETFLEHFIGKRSRGRIFTTNYDLLLCWAVAPDRNRIKPEKRFIAYEGFAGGQYDSCGSATIIYLHGALHLYAKSGREARLQYQATGVALHDQVSALLDRGEYPIIVTEGASSLKVAKSPGFLRDALAAFKGTCRGSAKKALFTLGHGLGPEDNHILEWIPKATIETVCLGAYGRQEMDVFRDIAAGWIREREKASKPPLRVYLFDSSDVVWGPKLVTES